MKQQFICRLVTLVGFCAALNTNSVAATITQTYSGSFPATISGTLPNQASVLLENFTLPSISNLTITTTSYAGGGFETNLLLFSASGSFITSGNPFGSVDPGTGIVGDMRLTAPNLAAGSYTLALTDFLLNQSLTATNLSDGFTANFGSGTTFADSNGNQRNGNFAFTISTASAATPEPATAWLAAAPFLCVLAIRARRYSLNRQ